MCVSLHDGYFVCWSVTVRKRYKTHFHSSSRKICKMSYYSDYVIPVVEPSKKKRKVITQEGRTVIVNVYKFLKEEYLFTMMHKDCDCDLSHLRNIAQRTADATNVSLRTVAQLLREDRQKNGLKADRKVFKFKKAKPSVPVADGDKLRQELELMETVTLSELNDEDLSHGTVEVTLQPVQVKKEVDGKIEISWQPGEIKQEEAKEMITWREAEVKTEAEEEDEINWKEVEFKTEVEEGTLLEEVGVKYEADDYEITIEEECIG